ncbi:MAG: efflux RND transporter periplasmic adaptor subunit [Alphaproteobacteria bacterium]|nr:efflux RND transporter periplasmic adaptor subunit [Alphaproteobacteria bacterium]
MTLRHVFLLSTFPVLLGVASAFAQEQPALVQVDAVRTEPLNQTRPVLGRIVTKRQGQVAVRVGGLVIDVRVDVGDRVTRGAVLVELDAEPVQYDVDLADAEYESAVADQATAEAEIDLLENELLRLDRLKESAAFSKARLEDKLRQITVAKSRLSAATARLGQYRAKQQASRRNLEDMVIKAPYDGVVTRRLVSPGAYVRLGDPVVALIDDGAIEIEADVPVDQLTALFPGTEVEVTIAGMRSGAAVRAVVPEENPLTRTRAVRFTPTVEAAAESLAVAQSVTLDIPIGAARDVTTVSKDGVIQRPNGAMVFLVKDAAATPQPVRLGAAVDGRFEVLDGLGDGDLVVIRGNERLRPGQPVTYPGAPGNADGEPATGESPIGEGQGEG